MAKYTVKDNYTIHHIIRFFEEAGYTGRYYSLRMKEDFTASEYDAGRTIIDFSSNYEKITPSEIIPPGKIMGKDTPLNRVKHLFVLFADEQSGDATISLFTDFEKNIQYIYEMYLNEEKYKNLTLYFIENTNIEEYSEFSMIPVSFYALIENVSIENFGEIKVGQVVDRAVLILNEEDNTPIIANNSTLSEHGLTPSSYMEEHGLNNILELVLHAGDMQATHSHPIYRYFTTIAELNKAAVSIAEEQGESVAVIVGDSIRKGTVNIENHTVTWENDIEEMFEYSKTYWQSVYEEE